MNQNPMKHVLDAIAQRNVPENINLWPRIAANIERKSFMQTVRAQPVLALLFVLLALAFLSGVAYAIGKATGYIPGVGIVDQSAPLRILAEPVAVERDGLTVTISSVIADSTHTVVAYSMDGIIVPKMDRAVCGEWPSLWLPDGSSLDVIDVEDGGPWGARAGSTISLEQAVTYSSIPSHVQTVTFTLPCVLPEGTGPEDWQIPLILSPAPDNYATPAVEVGATFTASHPGTVTTPGESPDPANTSDSPYSPDGSGLYLDQVIELPGSFILVGNFTDAGDLPGGLVVDLDPYADLPYIEDGSGNAVDFKVRDDIEPATSWADRYWVRTWAYEIPKPVTGPVTITLDQIDIGLSNTAQFNFEAGENLQTGQMSKLNLPLQLGPYTYVMDSVEVIENGYLFRYHSGIDVPAGSALLFNIRGATSESNASTLVTKETVIEYSESITFSSPLPGGSPTVEVTLDETVPLQGPWTLTWMPPGK
jgi:hypothetical protein